VKLYAISDLHVGHAENMAFVRSLRGEPGDWLILGGDLGERVAELTAVFEAVTQHFAKVFWVPGNHELWSHDGLRGQAKYQALIEVCRAFKVVTPEDPFVEWPGSQGALVIVPMFLLYDYSFRPASVARENAIEWAAEQQSVCSDEAVLRPDPYPSREAWCDARVAATARRLEALPPTARTILVNHFPLRQAHAVLPRIPHFSMWCGTVQTDDWHRRYRAEVVVYGHLHLPRTFVDEGVAFEEVSLGYPRERVHRAPPTMRQIWPRR